MDIILKLCNAFFACHFCCINSYSSINYSFDFMGFENSLLIELKTSRQCMVIIIYIIIYI